MMLSKKYKLLLLGVVVIGLMVYAYVRYEHNKNIIAKIGQFEISKKEFAKELAYRSGNYAEVADKQLLLEEMIVKKLFLNKAYSMELPSRESIQREYNQILMAKVREEHIEKARKAIEISDDDVKKSYEVNKELYKIPNKRQFAILFFKKRLKNSEKEKIIVSQTFSDIEALAKENKLGKAKKGFGSYAINYSEHQVSRYRGGELGWFSQGKNVNWEQEVLDVGFKLKDIGDLSGMIETKKGYYLIRLMDETKEKYQAFNKVKAKVRHQLILAKQKEVKESFNKVLRAEFDIEVDLSKLGDLNVSTSIKEKRPPNGLL